MSAAILQMKKYQINFFFRERSTIIITQISLFLTLLKATQKKKQNKNGCVFRPLEIFLKCLRRIMSLFFKQKTFDGEHFSMRRIIKKRYNLTPRRYTR